MTLKVEIQSQKILETVSFDGRPSENAESLLEWVETKSDLIAYGCRSGSCGTCMVEVLEGEDLLEEMTPQEEDTLSRTSRSPQCRLSCRAKVVEGADGVICIKPVF